MFIPLHYLAEHQENTKKSISMSNYRVMYDNNNLTKAEKSNPLNRFHHQLPVVHTWIENVNPEKRWPPEGQPDAQHQGPTQRQGRTIEKQTPKS